MAGLTLVGALAFLFSAAIPAGASGSSSVQVKAAEAQAKKQLLVHSDFPSNWVAQGKVTTSKGTGGASNFPGGQDTVTCLGISKALLAVSTPSATSPTFSTKDGLDSVENTVSIFPSPKLASQAFAAISGANVPGCLTTAFQGAARQEIVNAIGHGITVGTITVSAADPTRLTSHASGFTLSFPVNYNGNNLNAAITIISVVHGKSDSQFTISVVGNPLSVSLEKRLLSTAYGRS